MTSGLGTVRTGEAKVQSLSDWIDALRASLENHGLDGLAPFDIGDGTGGLPGERTVQIMLADLDHLGHLPPESPEWRDVSERRRALLANFRSLRGLIGEV